VVRYIGRQVRIIAPDPSEEIGWMPGLRMERAGPQLLMATCSGTGARRGRPRTGAASSAIHIMISRAPRGGRTNFPMRRLARRIYVHILYIPLGKLFVTVGLYSIHSLEYNSRTKYGCIE
jgi:hypothetical protein